MAFLDNSGDIILDAVLTEIGRKRMSSGRFRISKFSLGDDEINYETYNKNHPSGSAYYDLEILQTPVFEATTGANSRINFGLMNIGNRNLLYLPVIKRNEIVTNAAQLNNNVYYLAVRDGVTADALATAFGASTAAGNLKVLRAGKTDGTAIVLETGLDTSEIAPTRANKTSYLVTNGLQESSFSVSMDTRFLASVYGPGAGTVFNNGGPEGESRVRIRLQPSSPSTLDRSIVNYATAKITAIDNNVYKSLTDTVADTATSVIAGPRANMTALNFSTKLLTADDYSRHGKTGQTIAGAAGTYRYIDTTVKIVGTTGITDQLPIRIIQKE